MTARPRRPHDADHANGHVGVYPCGVAAADMTGREEA